MAIYVFGYGALIHLKHIKELGKKERKSCPVMVTGLKRSLNVSGDRHLVYGVKDVKTASCNGLLFKVSPEELVNLVEREKLYTMKPLAKNRIEFAYNKTMEFKPDDQIICFYPQAKYVLTKKQLLAKPAETSAYVRRCKAGAGSLGADFLRDFIETTTT